MQFVGWHVVATPRDSHCDSFHRLLRRCQADKAKDDRVTTCCGFLQKCKFVPHWVRKDRLEDKTSSLLQEFTAQIRSRLRGSLWVQGKLLCQHIGVDKPQAGRREISMKKGRLPCTIGASDRHHDRALIELGKIHHSTA